MDLCGGVLRLVARRAPTLPTQACTRQRRYAGPKAQGIRDRMYGGVRPTGPEAAMGGAAGSEDRRARAEQWSDEYTQKLGQAYEEEVRMKQSLRDSIVDGESAVVKEVRDSYLRVGLVGRSGVGKSSLHNVMSVDFVEKGIALANFPALTSDSRETEGLLGRMSFTVVDTPGMHRGIVLPQTAAVVATLDVVLLVVDGSTGLTEDDHSVIQYVASLDAPALVLANKCDQGTEMLPAEDLEALAMFGSPVRVSGLHGTGLGTLQDLLAPLHAVREAERKADEWELEDAVLNEGDAAAKTELAEVRRADRSIRAAIVGNPNAGKSSLLNQLLGYRRSAVGEAPGTTRDAVSVSTTFRGHRIKFFDCPGFTSLKDRWLVHNPKQHHRPIREPVNYTMHQAAVRVCQWSSVILYVFDARFGLTKQVRGHVQMLLPLGRPVVLVANKWDEVEAKLEVAQRFERDIHTSRTMKSTTLVCASGKKGLNVTLLMETLLDHHRRWHTHVTKGRLNMFWAKVQSTLHIPRTRSKVRQLVQVASAPPTFVLFLTRQRLLMGSLASFFIHKLRKEFELHGIPIRLVQRRKDPSVFNVLGYTNPQKVYEPPPKVTEGARWGAWAQSVQMDFSRRDTSRLRDRAQRFNAVERRQRE
eukprot:TRINITY_DN26088_c0_g1_i1.p1 TRINITY_DN26088_c0_g1~~TRINITY_DN26088_c0_g1_i1.p1  ORF type:complete len:642 (+),score=224.04 TRINITY_DN26088_c0_g1_i1:60-1985(+)